MRLVIDGLNRLKMRSVFAGEGPSLAAQRGVTNVRFEVISIYELPFPDGSFDAAFANTVLMHLREPVWALAVPTCDDAFTIKETYTSRYGTLCSDSASRFGSSRSSSSKLWLIRDLLEWSFGNVQATGIGTAFLFFGRHVFDRRGQYKFDFAVNIDQLGTRDLRRSRRLPKSFHSSVG